MLPDVIKGGSVDLAIGETVIQARYLGDISPNYEEGTRESNTLGGKRTTPSGLPETAEFGFTFFIKSMDDLKAFWGDIYSAPTDEAQLAGNFKFGAGECQTRVPVAVNIHYTCDENSDNDVHMYAVLFAFTFNPTYNDSDGLSIEVMGYMQPTDEGYMQIGAGDLAEPTLWDAAAQDWLPVASS